MLGSHPGIDETTLQWLHDQTGGEKQLLALSFAPLGITGFSRAWSKAVLLSFVHNYTRIQLERNSNTFSFKSGGIVEYIT